MKKLFFILFTLCSTYLQAQTYQVGHISATFTDSSRGNRSVPVEIYYPADVAGDNVSFAAGLAGKVPAISFGHGFVMTWDTYSNIREALVTHGYIMVFPTTEGSFSPSHDAFGKDLVFALQQLMVLGNTSASVLYNRVDTQHCVMGHSMGGGAAFLAAGTTASIKAIVTFAAAETTPSAIGAAANIYASSLVFAGLNDCISPPAANQEPMYNASPASCKHYIGITGGSHCQMAESNVACSFGENTCTPAPAISRATQHAVIDSYLVSWLDHTLKGSCAAGARFDNLLLTDVAVSYQKNCSLCSTASTSNVVSPEAIKVFPNPCGDQFQVILPAAGGYTISLYSVTGSCLLESPITGNTPVSMHNIEPGVYIYDIAEAGISLKKGVLVRL